MPLDLSLRERFWRDVAVASGQDIDPQSIREAVEDMMRNYRVDQVPGFEVASETNEFEVPDASSFSEHSAFAPVLSRSVCDSLPPSLGCFSAARPIFVGPRRLLRRRKTRPEPRQPDHFPGGGNPGITAADMDQPANPTPAAVVGLSPWYYHPPPIPLGPPHQYVWVFPTSPWSAIGLAGGHHRHPLPGGGAMPQWTPGTWPPLDWAARDVPVRLSPHLIPNPNNAHLPAIDWNVARHPSTATRLTPNHVVVDMRSVWADSVTDTGARAVVVTCDDAVGCMSALWGPIVVADDDDDDDDQQQQQRARPVTVRDLFDAVHRYFQVPLTYPEVRYVCGLHPSNYRRLTDAYRERCRESAGLPGWEAKQGYKRADVLGDRKYWWGAWVSSRDGVWWLNLGLVNPAHRTPPR